MAAAITLGVFIWLVRISSARELVQQFKDLPSMLDAMLETGRSLRPQVAALLEKYGLMSGFGDLLKDPVVLGGILGMIIVIPLTAFAVVFWRLLKKKYIGEVV